MFHDLPDIALKEKTLQGLMCKGGEVKIYLAWGDLKIILSLLLAEQLLKGVLNLLQYFVKFPEKGGRNKAADLKPNFTKTGTRIS